MVQSSSEPDSIGEERRMYLREWRTRRYLSMRDLAREAGIALETVRGLELPSGNRQPFPRTVRKVAKALGLRPDDLYRMPEEGE